MSFKYRLLSAVRWNEPGIRWEGSDTLCAGVLLMLAVAFAVALIALLIAMALVHPLFPLALLLPIALFVWAHIAGTRMFR